MPAFMIVAMLFWPAVIGTGFYFVRRYVRAVERRAGSDGALEALSERLLRVEDALETTRSDLARLEESHDFTQRLLAERAGKPELPR